MEKFYLCLFKFIHETLAFFQKLTEQIAEPPPADVWNSGRPKRSCIRTKRLSLDDTTTNCKTYYKVEVVTGKSKTNSSEQDKHRKLRSQSPKQEEERKDTGLIVKFKKLRSSELIQLNNEATNFLFPRKVESDKEDNEVDLTKRTNNAKEKNCSAQVTSDSEDCYKKIKVEDESSTDSFVSQKSKKKRRTHAEAFILDNQKYYKFETPGSRLVVLFYLSIF